MNLDIDFQFLQGDGLLDKGLHAELDRLDIECWGRPPSDNNPFYLKELTLPVPDNFFVLTGKKPASPRHDKPEIGVAMVGSMRNINDPRNRGPLLTTHFDDPNLGSLPYGTPEKELSNGAFIYNTESQLPGGAVRALRYLRDTQKPSIEISFSREPRMIGARAKAAKDPGNEYLQTVGGIALSGEELPTFLNHLYHALAIHDPLLQLKQYPEAEGLWIAHPFINLRSKGFLPPRLKARRGVIDSESARKITIALIFIRNSERLIKEGLGIKELSLTLPTIAVRRDLLNGIWSDDNIAANIRQINMLFREMGSAWISPIRGHGIIGAN